jgi:hypothetical protein
MLDEKKEIVDILKKPKEETQLRAAGRSGQERVGDDYVLTHMARHISAGACTDPPQY